MDHETKNDAELLSEAIAILTTLQQRNQAREERINRLLIAVRNYPELVSWILDIDPELKTAKSLNTCYKGMKVEDVIRSHWNPNLVANQLGIDISIPFGSKAITPKEFTNMRGVLRGGSLDLLEENAETIEDLNFFQVLISLLRQQLAIVKDYDTTFTGNLNNDNMMSGQIDWPVIGINLLRLIRDQDQSNNRG